MNIRAFQPNDEATVIDLWDRCGLLRPQNNPRADIARKMEVSPELFLVGVLNGQIMASVMAGYDGHRGWLYYVGVAPEFQKRGYGRQIVGHAEALLRALGCPKINLQVRGMTVAITGPWHKRVAS